MQFLYVNSQNQYFGIEKGNSLRLALLLLFILNKEPLRKKKRDLLFTGSLLKLLQQPCVGKAETRSQELNPSCPSG